jgi:porphobilinogen synthase
MVLMADLCLDEYTDHGHCGVLDSAGEVVNDATAVPVRPGGAGPG